MIPPMLPVGPSSRGDCAAVRGSLRGTGARGDACVCTLRPPAVPLNYHSAVSQRYPEGSSTKVTATAKVTERITGCREFCKAIILQ